jgi:hypothetical protein
LLERTIKQRVRFIVKAKAAGKAKIFIDSPSLRRLSPFEWIFQEKAHFYKYDDKQKGEKGQFFG